MADESTETSVSTGPLSRLRTVARTDGPYLLVLLLGAILITSLFASRYTKIGPVDELQHIDYAQKASRGHLVAIGERFGEPAMREEACRGIDAAFQPPPCDAAVLAPEVYQEAGFNTAAPHPPLYYVATGIGARLLSALPGVDSFVTGARLMGGIWLALGLIISWYLLAELGLSKQVRLGICLTMATIPLVAYSAATVNNDALALAAGASTLLVTLRYIRGRTHWIWLTVVAAVVMTIRATNLAALMLCCLVLLLATRTTERRPGISLKQAIIGIGAIGASSVLAVGAWVAISTSRTVYPPEKIPMSQRFRVDSIGFETFLSNVLNGAPPTADHYWPAAFASSWIVLWTGLIGFAIIAGAVGSALEGSATPLRFQLGSATALAMLATGPLFVAIGFIQGHGYAPPPPRYGMSLIPACLACFALCLGTRKARFIAPVAAACGFALIVGVLMNGPIAPL